MNTIEHADDWASPGYCTCGRWGRDRVIQSGARKGQTLEGCPGLAAVERGEVPPQLDRVVWVDVNGAEVPTPCVPYCEREVQPHHGACLQANP